MADPELIKTILNFGSFGLVAWLFFHTYSTLIPGLHARLERVTERFERALELQHTECKEILDRQQKKFDQMLAEYRDLASRLEIRK
jgi:hypothetical protein